MRGGSAGRGWVVRKEVGRQGGCGCWQCRVRCQEVGCRCGEMDQYVGKLDLHVGR